MKFCSIDLPGVFEITPQVSTDVRGSFVKTFHAQEYADNGIEGFDFQEEYYSVSKKNVLRGLHFQLPPHDHEKLVYCLSGEVLDVFLDLRKNSVTFGQARSLILSEDKANILYLPKGFAHGFLVLSDLAIMVYKTTSVYAPKADVGLHWKSCEQLFSRGDELPLPIISERDQQHPYFSEFNSPF
ncbi:MAG: dTDP-4-dehydrorhamnose 3,5-epimerase [Gammaproteobacteria bacterium CG11_big_fil_rev_8_21_14_0_20_46_22]|nr:MAG: dTDP-4-dehydrorhamnose 3,5-epimerase [Gammaproteobacteria bacterium CG12_big_fil_rev_8_21_14_0_65_46_12]PIR10346.1 MAG: dTDP-4-dehydrorhamnose 3,5-epimerase [Gammaproteobacteria bacterium CG11_big_fil_rev_8_21_14_0_20_46_22]